MNHIGIFDDLNYMSAEEHKDELKRWVRASMQNCEEYLKWNVYNSIELEFMDYVAKGIKSFLKSPF